MIRKKKKNIAIKLSPRRFILSRPVNHLDKVLQTQQTLLETLEITQS